MLRYYSVEDRLMNGKDLDGEEPSIYMSCGTKTAGKTFSAKRFLLRHFLQNGEQFILLYRYVYEMADCEATFMNDLKQDPEFTGLEMDSVSEVRGLYRVLMLGDKECGFACYLNNADTLKKFSARFSGVKTVFFDEFISETDHYCKDEITKFQSFNNTIARGYGEQSRYVRYIMCSNLVTVFNPYFIAFGVTKRLSPNTRFLRGNGWVLEMVYNESAKQAMKKSAFNKAFAGSSFLSYAMDNKALNDSDSFIAKLPIKDGIYQLTLVHNGQYFGIWLINDRTILYCSRKYDKEYGKVCVLNVNDHGEGTIMLGFFAMLAYGWRKYYDAGQWRFENADCKNALLDFLISGKSLKDG